MVLDGVRPGDALDAVVFPAAPGVLVAESGSQVQRVAVESAGRVRLALPKGERATVRFEGATATLHEARVLHGASRRGSSKPRRVLLVVIDTLRDDAVTRETTPELLDAFAGGTRFTRAYSTASWTLPSMGSLLSGKPRREIALPDGSLIALGPGETTVASDFAARGFVTVGITANYTVNHENGFSAGFDLFLAEKVLGHGDWPDADWVLARAQRTLEWFPDRDLFLYLHLMEPHDPYVDHQTGEAIVAPSSGQEVESAAVERMRAAYLGEARYVTARVATFLGEAGPFERVVVTADHGEELGDHGGWKHGPTVYPEVVRVPLLVRGGGVEPGEIDRPVSMLDLRDWLGSEQATLASAFTSEVDTSTFAHGAPRFAAVDDGGETVLFARGLTASEPGYSDPIGDWLLVHHPALVFVDPTGASRDPTTAEAEAAALRLVRSFDGLAAGQWVWIPAAVGRLRVEIEGAIEDGWWWGGAGRVDLRISDAVGPPTRIESGRAGMERLPAAADDSRHAPSATTPTDARPKLVTLDVETASPFTLIFVRAVKGGRLRVVEGGALDRLRERPDTAPRDRAVTWSDPGRPPATLEGIDATMERLRTQGYI